MPTKKTTIERLEQESPYPLAQIEAEKCIAIKKNL